MIRGKSHEEALMILEFLTHKACDGVMKTLYSLQTDCSGPGVVGEAPHKSLFLCSFPHRKGKRKSCQPNKRSLTTTFVVNGISILWSPRRALPRAHPPGAAPPSPRT